MLLHLLKSKVQDLERDAHDVIVDLAKMRGVHFKHLLDGGTDMYSIRMDFGDEQFSENHDTEETAKDSLIVMLTKCGMAPNDITALMANLTINDVDLDKLRDEKKQSISSALLKAMRT